MQTIGTFTLVVILCIRDTRICDLSRLYYNNGVRLKTDDRNNRYTRCLGEGDARPGVTMGLEFRRQQVLLLAIRRPVLDLERLFEFWSWQYDDLRRRVLCLKFRRQVIDLVNQRQVLDLAMRRRLLARNETTKSSGPGETTTSSGPGYTSTSVKPGDTTTGLTSTSDGPAETTFNHFYLRWTGSYVNVGWTCRDDDERWPFFY